MRDEDMSLVAIDNSGDANDTWPTEGVSRSKIHFYFCVDGKASFEFGPHYSREIQQQKNYFFYNPEKDLPFVLKIAAKTRMIILSITLEGLHRLFVHDALPFLKPENVNRTFYDERDIPAHLYVVLNQLFTIQISQTSEQLYYKAKTLELLSLYFSTKTSEHRKLSRSSMTRKRSARSSMLRSTF
ncbi:MAG: hypothetical protein WDO15_23860 [Bacteroidota bacterium]